MASVTPHPPAQRGKKARLSLLSPKAKGDPEVCSQPGQGPGRGHKTHRTSPSSGTPPPARPPAQVRHPELSQNLIPLPPSSQPPGGSWQLPSFPLMEADKPIDLHSRQPTRPLDAIFQMPFGGSAPAWNHGLWRAGDW